MQSLPERAAHHLSALDRLPSVDEVHAELSEWVERTDGAHVMLLGQASDGTPMVAYGAPGDEHAPVMLVLAGAGESVASPAVASLLARHAAELDGSMRLWVIPTCEPARLRLNEPGLGLTAPTVGELVATWRPAYGPGEEAEASLPIDHDVLWQPDERPDGAGEELVDTPPESVALARALRQLRPACVLSLREVLIGGVTVALSQELEADDDYRRLLDAACSQTLALNAGAKLRAGRQLHGVDGVVVLSSLSEELARLRPEDGQRFTGGVTVPQFLSSVHSEFVYLSADLPRLSAARFADGAVAEERRTVHVRLEEREKAGKPVPHRITLLEAPDGGVADGAELRVEPVKSADEVVEGRFEGMEAAGGWLAVEACLRRKDVLRAAYELLRAAAPVCQHNEHLRAMQLLRETESLDKLVKSYQGNKRYSRPATVAERAFWAEAFPSMTAAMLAEATHCLSREDAANPLIAAARDGLQGLIDGELAGVGELRAVGMGELAGAGARLAAALQVEVAGGGAARVRARARIDAHKRVLTAARRTVRDAKALKRPKAERLSADAELAGAEARMAELEAQLEALQARADDDPAAPEPSAEADAAVGTGAQPAPAAPSPSQSTDRDAAPAPAPASELDVPERVAEPVDEIAPDRAEPAIEETSASQPSEPAARELAPAPDSAVPADDERPLADLDRPSPADGQRDAEPSDPTPAASGPAVDLTKPADDRRPRVTPDVAELATSGAQNSAPDGSDGAGRVEPVSLIKRDGPPPAAPAAATSDVEDDDRIDLGSDLTALVARPRKSQLVEDFEERVPALLGVDPEWGRGPINWKSQLPDPFGAPPLRRMARQAISAPETLQGGPAASVPERIAATPPAAPARTPAPPSDVAAQAAVQLGEIAHTTVGFRRRRVELTGSHAAEPAGPPPAAVPATAGTFRLRRRSF